MELWSLGQAFGIRPGAAPRHRALLPLLLAVLGLAGAGIATWSLHRAATATLQRAK